MAVLTSKWTKIIMATLVVVSVALAVLGKKSVHSEIIIEESPQKIWNVLMDEDNYPKWNDLLFPVAGTIKQDNITYNLVQPNENPIEIKMRVKQLIPLKHLNQKGGMFGIFTYDHHYILDQIGNNTKVTIHEDFRGIAVHFINLDWIQQAYSDLNTSLREYIIELTYEIN